MRISKSFATSAHSQDSVWLLAFMVIVLLSVRLILYSLLAGGAHVLPDNLCRWDCGWYMSIVQDGYPRLPNPTPGAIFDQASWAFFPVFPFLITLVCHLLSVSPVLAGVIVANISLGFFVFFAAKYISLINPGANKIACVVFLSSFPYSFYFSIPYTESLYAALTIISFWFLERGKTLSTSIFAAFLSATRVTGVLLTPVIVWRYLLIILTALRRGEKEVAFKIFLAAMLPIVVAPLGLFLYMVYLYIHVGDGFAFFDVQRAWGRSSQNPISAIWYGLQAADLTTFAPLKSESGTLSALCALAALSLSVRLLIIRRYAECWFLLASTIIPLTHGLASLPRYSFAQPIFLVFLFEYLWGLNNRPIFWGAVAVCVPLQLLFVQLWMRGYAFLH